MQSLTLPGSSCLQAHGDSVKTPRTQTDGTHGGGGGWQHWGYPWLKRNGSETTCRQKAKYIPRSLEEGVTAALLNVCFSLKGESRHDTEVQL